MNDYWRERKIIQSETRLLVWRRDGGRCIVCGGRASEVHEIIPKSALPGKDNLDQLFSLKNSCCLCKKHHGPHTHTKWARRTLLGLMRMRYGYEYAEEPYAKYFRA